MEIQVNPERVCEVTHFNEPHKPIVMGTKEDPTAKYVVKTKDLGGSIVSFVEEQLAGNAKEVAPDRVYDFEKRTPEEEKQLLERIKKEEESLPPLSHPSIEDIANIKQVCERWVQMMNEENKEAEVKEEKIRQQLRKLVVLYIDGDALVMWKDKEFEEFKKMMERIPEGWEWVMLPTKGQTRMEIVAFQ